MFSKPEIPEKDSTKHIITLATILTVLLLFYPFSTASEEYSVTKVYDGDTVDVERGRKVLTVRVAGIDTPETSSYNKPEEFKGIPQSNWKCLQRWGYNAKEYVTNKISGQNITLKYRKGVLTVERGAFGRLIAEIHVNNSRESLSEELVEKGYARSYGDKYIEEERQARKESVGLWECTEDQ